MSGDLGEEEKTLTQRNVSAPLPEALMIEEAENRMRGISRETNSAPDYAAQMASLQTAMNLLAEDYVAALGTITSQQNEIAGLHNQLRSEFDEHTNLQSEIDQLEADLAKRPVIYRNNAVFVSPKMWCKAASTTITGGVARAVFYLTSDGTASGTALFTEVFDETIDFEVNDSTNSYRYSWTLSADLKTLTVVVTRSAPTGVLTLLGISLLAAPSATPNGTVVRCTLWGR